MRFLGIGLMFVLFMLLVLGTAGCEINWDWWKPKPPVSLVKTPDLAKPVNAAKAAADSSHKQAAAITQHTQNIDDKVTEDALHKAIAEDLAGLYAAAAAVEKTGSDLDVAVVAVLVAYQADIVALTKQRDELNATVATQAKQMTAMQGDIQTLKEQHEQDQKEKEQIRKNGAHDLFLWFIGLGVVVILAGFGICFLPDHPIGKGLLVSGVGLAIVSIVGFIDRYFDQLLLGGGITLGVLALGVIGYIVWRARKSHENVQQGDEQLASVVQFFEGFKHDVAKSAPAVARKWFGDEFHSGEAQLQLGLVPGLRDKLARIRKAPGFVRAAPPKAD